jgi:hypothetical protein
MKGNKKITKIKSLQLINKQNLCLVMNAPNTWQNFIYLRNSSNQCFLILKHKYFSFLLKFNNITKLSSMMDLGCYTQPPFLSKIAMNDHFQ